MTTRAKHPAVKTLVVVAPVTIVMVMLGLFDRLVEPWGDRWGLLGGFVSYWLVCGTAAALVLDLDDLRRLLRGFEGTADWERVLYWVIVWIPAVGTLLGVFLTYAPDASIAVMGLAALLALLNASVEEVFWRGVYAVCFPRSLLLGFLYPAVCFGLWHFAIYLSSGNPLQGGAATLVGGALAMGLIWGWVAWRGGYLLPPLAAHVLTNFLAFTGYISVLS